MNGLTMSQKYYVTNGLNRNFILGRDWPKQIGVRMYFDLGMLRTWRNVRLGRRILSYRVYFKTK